MRLADIERCTVRAQIKAVGEAHFLSLAGRHHLAAAVAVGSTCDAPDLTLAVLEVRITRIERPVACDRQIVRLIKTRRRPACRAAVGMKVDARHGLAALEHEHIVVLEIGNIIRPSRSKRAPLPMLPAGSVANNSDCVAPGISLPIVPLCWRFITYKVPAASTAGPSMPKVYPVAATHWDTHWVSATAQSEAAARTARTAKTVARATFGVNVGT